MTDFEENTKLKALISLLDEPDEKSFALVRKKILSYENEAIPLLDNLLENTFDSLMQERIREIIDKLQIDKLAHDFSAWVNFSSSDLLAGFLLISTYGNHKLDREKIIRQVEQIRMDVWLELHDNLTALENIKVLNHIFYEVHHFSGTLSGGRDPKYYFLDHLLETRKGNPLSLGILYMLVAQQLNMPVFGVDLTQHFILSYLQETGITKPGAEDVLFYINPFNQGSVFTRREIELFIRQLKIKPETIYFSPCSNIAVIEKMLLHLISAYHHSGETDKTTDLEMLLKILDQE